MLKKFIRKYNARLLPAIVNLATIALLLTVTWIGLFQDLSLQALDLFFKLKPNESPDNRIALVQITEDDIARFQNYPFTESQWAAVLERIRSGAPAAIGFDIFRDYPFPKGDNSLNDLLKNDGRIFGITMLDPDRSKTIKGPPALARTGRLGDVNLWFDPDQILRRVHLWGFPKDYPDVPNLSLQLVYRYLKQKYSIEPTADENGNLRLGNVSIVRNPPRFGDYRTVGGGGYQQVLNWRKPLAEFPAFTISRVLANDFDPGVFKDKIVLVGVARETFSVKDVFPSPLGAVSGIEFQAQAVSSLLSAVLDGRPLMKSWTDWQKNLWFVFWTGALGWVFWKLAGKRSFVLFSGSLAFLLGSLAFLWIYAYLDFLWRGYWIPVVPLSIALPFLYFVNWAFYYLRQLLEENVRLATERESARDFIIENEIYDSLARVGANLASEVHDSITEFDNNYTTLNNYINLLKASLSQFLSVHDDKNYSNLFNIQIQNIIVPLTNCKVNFNNILFRLSFLPNADSLLPKDSYNSYEDFKALTRNIVIATVRAERSKFSFLDPLENHIHFRVEKIPSPSRSFQTAHYVQIVAILLNNALTALSYKRFDDDSEPRVDLIVGTRDNWLTITVTDNGIGLPAGVPPRSLLGKFVTRWPRPNKRMGNELYRCKELVDKNYGTIELLADGDRTRVEVALFLSR
jgi:CHASE2 domain-containing sensor protein